MGMLGHQTRPAPVAGEEGAAQPEDKLAADIQAMEVELCVAELGAENTGGWPIFKVAQGS